MCVCWIYYVRVLATGRWYFILENGNIQQIVVLQNKTKQNWSFAVLN